jgi:hypothetical protein
MLRRLAQIRIPSFRSVLARGLAALTDVDPIYGPMAGTWMSPSPFLQYRFTNFDLFLMDQDLTGEWDGMEDPEGSEKQTGSGR